VKQDIPHSSTASAATEQLWGVEGHAGAASAEQVGLSTQQHDAVGPESSGSCACSLLFQCDVDAVIPLSPQGVVRSTKMTRTIVVRRDYLHYIKKYAR